MAPEPPPVGGSSLWARDRWNEVRQSLSARRLRAVVSVFAAALSTSAFLGLTGASRISEARVAARLDELRPTFFTVTRQDDTPLISAQLSGQLRQLSRLEGFRGAVAVAEVRTGGAPVTAHPWTSSSEAGQDSMQIFAVSANPVRSLGSHTLAGRDIDDGHVRRADRVVEVGEQAAVDLALPDMRGLPDVYIGGAPFLVGGVAAAVRDVPDLSDSVSMPYSTAIARFGPRALESQRVYVRGSALALPRLERLAPLVFDPARPSAIQITAMGDPVSLRSDIADQLSRLVGVVTVGAMLFGMLVVGITSFASVTERRQEFGVRRAVGARARDIAGFVVGETALVGLAGGLVGLAISAAALALESVGHGVGFPLSVVELVAAPSIGGVVGALAGMLPAVAAIRIDPYDALTT